MGLLLMRCIVVGCLAIGALRAGDAEGIVAIVDGRSITATELDARVGDRLLRVKNDEYAARLLVLSQYVDEILLKREAQERGLTVSDLLKEVSANVGSVTEAEARAVLESAPGAQQNRPTDDALRQAEASLQHRRVMARQTQFMSSLREKYPVIIRLDPPRLSGSVQGGHSEGPDEAPVSIIEFTDFQCPYCAMLNTTLQRIHKAYGGSVRIVAKQFPLPGHPQAMAASEAALCGAEQDKYWQMHETLFSEQALVAASDFHELAERAGLDVGAFEACFSGHKVGAEVGRDRLDGLSLGINSTPTFFVNGLLVVGAKPYDALREMIESELRLINRGTGSK